MTTLKIATLVWALMVTLSAQPTPPLTPQQAAALSVGQLSDLTLQLQSALQAQDLNKAYSLASTLSTALGQKIRPVSKPAPDQIRDMEAALGSAGAEGKAVLGNSIAVKALSVGDLDKAKYHATEALKAIEGARFPANSALIPEVLHESSIVLGTVALKRGNLFDAKRYLISAGSVSPNGSLFPGPLGPDFTLVKAIVEAGETDAALEYFAALRAWWKDGTAQLDQWSAALRGGGKPILPNRSRGF